MTRKLPSTAFVTLALALLCGCTVQDRGSVQLTQLCFPPTPDSNGACAFSSGGCSAVLAGGHLFVDLVTTGDTLVYPIQIDNQRQDNSDSASFMTNSNNATVERFEMRYEGTGLAIPPASSSQTVFVPAAGSAIAVVDLLPPGAGAALAAALPAASTEIVIKVSAHGRYSDDSKFDSADFAVPVSVTQLGGGVFACADTTKKLIGVCPQQGQTAVALCQ